MAKPKLALIPAAQGDKFYSVLPSDGVGDFDFTRNSSATRIAPTGFIEEVGAFGSNLILSTMINFNYNTFNEASTSGFHAINTAGSSQRAGTVDEISFVNGKKYRVNIDVSVVSGSAPFFRARETFATSPTLFSGQLTDGNNVIEFTSSNTLTGVLEFSSSNAAEYRVSNVSIVEVVGNKSRLNYDLLNGKVVNCPHYLLEPARTNLINYSEDFSQWTTSNATVSLNQIISPDGSLNADKFTPQTTANTFIYKQVTLSAFDYTFSVFVKYNGRQYLQLLFGSSASTDFSNFDLINGIVTSGAGKIKNYGNDWYKISLTANINSGTTEVYLWSIDNASSLRAASSTGNGIDGYYVWGAQVEEGSYPTSYIPTNGTTITRAAETANGSGNAATFNDSEGVLMAEISALSNDTSSKLISLTDGSQSNGIELFYWAGNSIYINLWSGGVSQGFLNYEIDIENFNKVCYTYKLNNTALWINGYKVDTDTSATMPIGLSELAFESGIGGNDFYGKTRELQYFDSALTDAQLETLTSWTSLQEMITSQLYTNY